MKIAIEGCAHGELEKIYECIEDIQRREAIKIDLLICCGDFQSVRNQDDLQCMAVPDKFKNMCTFYKYYSGEKRAPVLTLFIGGNHEASNYLQELPYGGWVAPNIYYLGRAGVVRFGNCRIGGISGIFKGRDYHQGLWESPPYNGCSLRTVYHVRSLDVFRLKQLQGGSEVHVMLSHDWPRDITDYGDREQLLRRKPFLREDIESGHLGSMPAKELLETLRPLYWFAAHLHCQFSAVVPHHDGSNTNVKETKFLALDKCLPRRRHLQVLEIPDLDGDKKLRHDPEWLAILKSTNHLLTVKNMDCHLPGPGCNERYNFTPTEEEKKEIEDLLGDNMLITGDTFVKTAPVYSRGSSSMILEPIANPQTTKLCELLGIDDPVQVVLARTGRKMRAPLSEESPCTPVRSFKMSLPSPSTPIVDDRQSIRQFKLNLPSPVTPVVNDNDRNKQFKLNPSPMTPIVNDSEPDSTFVSDTINTTYEANSSIDKSDSDICSTPMSGQKKTFKRRNHSIYTPDADADCQKTEESQNEVSPKTSKLLFKPSDEA